MTEETDLFLTLKEDYQEALELFNDAVLRLENDPRDRDSLETASRQLHNIKGFANENDDAKIFMQETKADGAPNLMIGEEDNLLHNKVVMHDNQVVYMAGGNGGRPDLKEAKNEEVATKKTVNRRSSK